MNEEGGSRDAYEAYRILAVEAVIKALDVCLKVTGNKNDVNTLTKDDGSPVTAMDFAIQAIISKVISDSLPNAVIIGEEKALDIIDNPKLREEVANIVNLAFPGIATKESDTQVLQLIDYASHEKKACDKFWVVDPIDGTKGFIIKKHYAICLALIEKGEVVLGVIGCPNISTCSPNDPGEVYYAVKNQGAHMITLENGTRKLTKISVNDVSDLRDVIITRTFQRRGRTNNYISAIKSEFNIKTRDKHVHSQCKYCLISQGEAHIYLREIYPSGNEEKIWDHASGVILVHEAGGATSDLDGRPLDFSTEKEVGEAQVGMDPVTTIYP